MQNVKSISSKMAEILHKTCKKGTFQVISGLHRDFPNFIFLTDFDAAKGVLGSFSRSLRKSDLKNVSQL